MLVWLSAGCHALLQSDGGGQIEQPPRRRTDPADVALPEGYRIEVVARELSFPTGVVFDDRGVPYVIEAGYAYGEVFGTPRLVRVGTGGVLTQIATGTNPPWTGAVWHEGAFYVAEGGEAAGGSILRVDLDGSTRVLTNNLPSVGDHHTNGPAIGPDGWIYFGQGTLTNAGVVGVDNHEMGWLARHPEAHDVPCRDVFLRGENFTSPDPFDPEGGPRSTGAFLPFGTPSTAGQRIAGELRCSGAVMRVHPGGGPPQLVAWGFRNPFGMAFSADGALYVTDNGYDVRGSRPVFGAPDWLWKVEPGAWYGWPEYVGSDAVGDPRFRAPHRPPPTPLLETPPGDPPDPIAAFDVHAAVGGLDFSRSAAFGHVGEAFVALFGDMAPAVGKVLAPVGFKVVRVDPRTGIAEEFAVNRGKVNGPASWGGGGGLERPLAVRFDPSGEALYVVDFGQMLVSAEGMRPRERTGVLWKITRTEDR